METSRIKIGPAQIGILILTLLTAFIHLSLGEPLFILNGIGYLVLLVAYFLPVAFFPRFHSLIRWVFAGYILLTIVLYFVFHPNGAWQTDGFGLMTKMIEAILLLLLVYDGQENLQQDTNPS